MEAIEQFKKYIKNIKGFSDKTIDVYIKYINKLSDNFWDYNELLSEIKLNSNNTKRVALSAVKCYYKFTNDKRFEEIELPKKTSKILPYVTYDEYKEMLQKINKNAKKQFMKFIIIRLLFETGIRASELLSIKKNDIKNNSIVINGKGNSQRVVNLSDNLINDLNTYILNVSENTLFAFSYKNLYKKITELSDLKKFSPHMFRRGYAKYCYSKGISIYDISLSMGHNDINTTAIYVRRNSEDVNLAHIFT